MDLMRNSAPEISDKKSQSRGSFASDLLKLVSGSMFAQVLGILTGPILSRLFAPDAYGLTALFTSLTGIVIAISCLRYELSIVLPVRDEDAANLLGVSLLSVAGVSSLAGLLFFSGYYFIPQWLNEPNIQGYLWLVPFSIFFGGVVVALNYWNTRFRRFGRLTISRVIRSLSSGFILISVGFLGYTTAASMIWTAVIIQIIVALFLVRLTWKDDGQLFRQQISVNAMLHGAKRYRKFPKYHTWAALLNKVSWQLPTFMFSIYFSPAVVGYYALGNRVLRKPMSLVGGSLSQVFFQRAADAKNDGTLAVLVEGLYRRLVRVGLLPAVLFSIVGRELFIVVYGPNWAEAGSYTQILAVWTFFWFISSPLGTLYSVLEKQEKSLLINGMIFVTRFVSLLIGGILDNIWLALFLFSISGIFTYGYLSLSIMRTVGINWATMFKILLSNLMVLTPMALALIALKIIQAGPIIIFIVTIFFISAYFLYIAKTDPDLMRIFGRIKLPRFGASQ